MTELKLFMKIDSESCSIWIQRGIFRGYYSEKWICSSAVLSSISSTKRGGEKPKKYWQNRLKELDMSWVSPAQRFLSAIILNGEPNIFWHLLPSLLFSLSLSLRNCENGFIGLINLPLFPCRY